MAFVIVGVALLAMKMAEFGPVAAWSWWVILLPFGLAVAWWMFADTTGLTQRRAMDKMDQKKEDRRLRNLQALGLGPRRERKARHAKDFPTQDAPRRRDPTTAGDTR
jgi:small Trp-rich protein